MGLVDKKILGVKITTSEKDIILEEVGKCLKLGVRGQVSGVRNSVKPLVIFTPNPEIAEFAQKDDNFRQIVNSAQINIPDGQGICWAINKIHKIEISRISGTDLMLELSKLAAKEGVTIGLIGGRAGAALATLECLKKKFPGLEGEVLEIGKVEMSDLSNLGYLGNLSDLLSKVTNWILQKKIGILFVALGHPKQEYLINSIKYQVLSIKYDKPLVLMAVGGAFDYISGQVSRAPVWMRERGLEWLYRLIKEPGRWKRQLAGVRFFLRIVFQ